MYSVFQPDDSLKVCIVGKSYSPEFYNYIKNKKVRKVLQKIAQETEEDFLKLASLLESFNVKILRPTLTNNYKDYIFNEKIIVPPYAPRDYTAMIKDTFFIGECVQNQQLWDDIRGSDWPVTAPQNINEFLNLDPLIIDDFKNFNTNGYKLSDIFYNTWQETIDHISSQGNKIIYGSGVNTASVIWVDNDLYVGNAQHETVNDAKKRYEKFFPDVNVSNIHVFATDGHLDSCIAVLPDNLLITTDHININHTLFQGWDILNLPNEGWSKMTEFKELKMKNKGKWWVPGEELNDDFTNYVETWLGHWVGFSSESVFDVNMLVIDRHNVICNTYNEKFFRKLEEHQITPHVCALRHRYFWDGGIHCVTSDIDRIKTTKT